MAPIGAVVKLYVDLLARVRVGDVIATGTDRRYLVIFSRLQARGKHAGRRHHLHAVVLERGCELGEGASTTDNPSPSVHRIRWYARGKR